MLQPIINVDGIYGRQAAKAKMEAYQLQTERTKEYLQLELNKAFMELQLAYKAVQVLEKANSTSEATLRYVENNFKQGYLQKTDVLTVQVRVNEVKNQLQYAKSNVQNASDDLAFLLQEDMNGKIYLPVENLEDSIIANSFRFYVIRKPKRPSGNAEIFGSLSQDDAIRKDEFPAAFECFRELTNCTTPKFSERPLTVIRWVLNFPGLFSTDTKAWGNSRKPKPISRKPNSICNSTKRKAS